MLRLDRTLPASDLDTSTMLLVVLLFCSATEEELALLCIQRPRTPATALKKPVDPAVSVRETASLAGASCCSSLSS